MYVDQTVNLLRFMLFGAACLCAGYYAGQTKVYEKFMTPESIELASAVHKITELN